MVVAPQCVLFLLHSTEPHNGFLYWVTNWTALQLVHLVCRLSDYSFKRRALFEGPVPCHPCASQRLLGIFGICVEKDLDVRCGYVSLFILIPAHPRPPVTLILLDDIQQLPLGHGNGAFVLTFERVE